jgi:hypothetical protein
MGNQIELVSIQKTTFASVGGHRVPLKSLIGDWEGNAWGDGKFPCGCEHNRAIEVSIRGGG